jgi:hypothetical protein
MFTSERAPVLGRITTRCLLTELTELREDIQLQSVILAEIDTSIRAMFTELRRTNLARYKPPAEE